MKTCFIDTDVYWTWWIQRGQLKCFWKNTEALRLKLVFYGIRQQLTKFSVGMYIGVVTVFGDRQSKGDFPKVHFAN